MTIKPKVLISRCLTFDNCRYDGGIINSEFIKQLKPFIDFETICPEVEIGLSVPRKWLSLIIKKDGKNRIYQKSTETDFTDEMVDYADKLFKKHRDSVDGFILKERSPSCGISNVKYYSSETSKISSGKDKGVFGKKVLEEFENYPIINEGRLRNFTLRERFLTKLFTFARFKKVIKNNKMKNLIKFHSDHKYLLQSFNEEKMRQLGSIAANHEKKETKKVINNYYEVLKEVFNETQSEGKNINILQHCFGFVSEYLTKEQREHFLDTLKHYRNNKYPLSVLQKMLESWIIEHNIDYLKNQYYFKPYPLDLMTIKDSGKGRDY